MLGPALAGLTDGLAERAGRARLLAPLWLAIAALLNRIIARFDHLAALYSAGLLPLPATAIPSAPALAAAPAASQQFPAATIPPDARRRWWPWPPSDFRVGRPVAMQFPTAQPVAAEAAPRPGTADRRPGVQQATLPTPRPGRARASEPGPQIQFRPGAAGATYRPARLAARSHLPPLLAHHPTPRKIPHPVLGFTAISLFRYRNLRPMPWNPA